MPRRSRHPVAFLFLGETLLIPHLYPIAASLSRKLPDDRIDAWVATATHEALLRRWIVEDNIADRVSLRRAPGFRQTDDPERGVNPELPAKLPMLARLVPHLLRASAVVCAEQTSLWLPRALPFMPPFIKTSHGVGTMSARDDRRRMAATLTLVPSENERSTYLERGMDSQRIFATGYVKAGFRHLARGAPQFAQSRPVILYNPHWRPSRSSWWKWGTEVIERILDSGRFNLIFAPHQRLAEGDPGLRAVCDRLNARDDAMADMESFAAVDGSYPHAADIYLGDTSSQMLEFLQRPRPVVFLDPDRRDWRADPELAMWQCGEVVTDLADLLEGIDRAVAGQPAMAESQHRFVSGWLGETDGSGPDVAADRIVRFLGGSG